MTAAATTSLDPPVTGRAGTVVTFGHADVSPEDLVTLLTAAHVTVVADVRSDRTSLRHDLDDLVSAFHDAGIVYVPLGSHLGGRPSDPSVYRSDGTVDHMLVRQQVWFEAGLLRLDAAIDRGYRVALMCVEDDPSGCHRHLLVEPALRARGYTVDHLRHRA